MGDCLHFSLRFNYDNPKHRKIIDILDGLDKREYASKTSFIITALEQYIDWIALEEAGKKVRESHRLKLGEVVTWVELDETLKSLKAELKSEMYEQFFQYISRSQTQIKQQMVESITNAEAYPEQKATEDSTDIADDLSKYEGVMESVLSWSEDE